MNIENCKVLDLIMRKKNAIEILNGSKKYEYRAFTSHWVKRLTDWHKDPEDGAIVADAIKPFDVIHFHPYNNAWFLDVAIGNYGAYEVTDELIAKHGMNCELPEKGETVFIFEIIGVIDTNLR